MSESKRNWNWRIWAGFAVALAATFSYTTLFVWWPVTRDVPWANGLLFVVALWLLGDGIRRAFREPSRYRGKISGSIFGVVSLALAGLFCAASFYAARSLPPGQSAIRVGQSAPDFELRDTAGKVVTLAGLQRDSTAVLLIFYRGYW